MMTLKESVIILNIFILILVSGLDIEGLEDLEICNPHDVDCIINIQDPKMRAWMANGQPKYGIKPIEPMKLKEVTISACGKKYKIEKLTVRGLSNKIFITEWSFDLENENLTYTHNYNLDVTAKRIVDKNGKTISKKNPFDIKIENFNFTLQRKLLVETGEDGQLYVTIPEIMSKKITDGDVKLKTKLKHIPCDRAKVEQAMAKAIIDAASTQLISSWLSVHSEIPAEDRYGPYDEWKTKPKPEEEKKKGCDKHKGLLSRLLCLLL